MRTIRKRRCSENSWRAFDSGGARRQSLREGTEPIEQVLGVGIQIELEITYGGPATAWAGWQDAVAFAQPRTMIARQRTRFHDHWARLSWGRQPGRPAIAAELRARGQLIEDVDLLIAAMALIHDMTLVAHNTPHFIRISSLQVDTGSCPNSPMLPSHLQGSS